MDISIPIPGDAIGIAKKVFGMGCYGIKFQVMRWMWEVENFFWDGMEMGFTLFITIF